MSSKNIFHLSLTIICLLTVCCTVCFGQNEASQKLTKIWETDTLFNKPESAVFNPEDGMIYVSNINGEYLARDGNGFISRIDTNGNILNLKWIEGLDNPQGLGIYKNNLYAADIDRVVMIDISKAQISRIYYADSARFLNDITVDKDGIVYISDSMENKIYRIKDDSIQVFLEDSFLDNPNGLLALDNGLFVMNFIAGVINHVNLDENTYTQFADGILNCDGIVSDGQDGYFVTGAWQGEIFHLSPSGEKTLLLDLGKEKTITADIGYIPEHHMLLVPTLNKTVIAYRWD